VEPKEAKVEAASQLRILFDSIPMPVNQDVLKPFLTAVLTGLTNKPSKTEHDLSRIVNLRWIHIANWQYLPQCRYAGFAWL
jgi:hypothetical protein